MVEPRDSPDKQLARLSPGERLEALMFGSVASPAQKLVNQAKVLQAIAKLLPRKKGETYSANLKSFQDLVGQLCTAALIENNAGFFKELASELEKPNEKHIQSTAEGIRFYLFAEKQPINAGQFCKRLKKHTGITLDPRTAGDIAHRHRLKLRAVGRPRKSRV